MLSWKDILPGMLLRHRPGTAEQTGTETSTATADQYGDSGQELSQDTLARLRARQLLTIARLTPLNAVANVFNVILSSIVLWGIVHPAIILIWSTLISLLMGTSVIGWYRMVKRPQPPQYAREQTLHRATWHAGLIALLWALPPAFLFHQASAEQQLFLTAISAGMMCAGGFALYTLPAAAQLFTGILGAASVIALASSDLASRLYLILLLLMYLTILLVSIVHAGRVFRAHVLAEMTSDNQKQVISLLLNDFEQSTADVLWEVDAQLTFRRTNNKLSELFGNDSEELGSTDFLSLVQLSQARLTDHIQKLAHSAYTALSTALKGGRAFRDIEVPMCINQRTVWWAITAKPTVKGGWRGVISDITESHQAQQRIWQLAHEDNVTGLTNRHGFQTGIESILAPLDLARPNQELRALLSIDLDRFKAVNDAFGHDAGDKLLQVVADRLRSHTRPQDLVARIGGDEFGLILQQLDNHEQALEIAERLVASINQPCQIDNASILVGASIGVAFIPEDGAQQDVILKHADLALYQAKARGRGKVVRFAPTMAATAQTRHRIEQALRSALQQETLTLAYQPQRHLINGKVTCVEALARWHDQQLGQIAPALFISVAEESSLIHTLGQLLLNQACQQLSRWPANLTVAVNISPLQLANPDIVNQVADTLKRHDVVADRLELEITETALLDDSHNALDKLHQLKALGVRITLDDFGTGYSSLVYLRCFPFDKIKIDRSFVSEMAQEPTARTIVGAIIQMASALNMAVVAEGVEEQQPLELLQQLGCTIAQGYHICRPLAPEAVAAYLEQYN